jgi:hypothetical protein
MDAETLQKFQYISSMMLQTGSNRDLYDES